MAEAAGIAVPAAADGAGPRVRLRDLTGSVRPLMVLGCTSGAGKSWLVTALCRWFARQGVDVVPFKAQNMSNNARVVDGGEIGVAQWLQARAAGVEPDVRMNPVLLKPEADTRSQVVVAGRASPELTAMPWRDRGPPLWPAMTAAFDSLRAEHELVVLEGAGSPAEINLPDLVNNRMLDHADAAALLVADIDRGGAFAHLYGTWSLVPDDDAGRGSPAFVLNRFRGDAVAARARTRAADRADRDGVRRGRADAAPRAARRGGRDGARRPRSGRRRRVAVLRFPYGSNLDELHLLARAAPRARSSSTRPTSTAPTSSCCRAPSTSPPTWPGCARSGLDRADRADVAGAASSGSAAGARCSAARSTTRTASRAGGPVASTDSDCCRSTTVLAGEKVTAPTAT